MPRDTWDLPVIGRAAEVLPASVDADARTVEVCWTTGATVQRARWVGWDGVEHYDEELSVDAEHIRLGRLNSGAPFLDSHRSWCLAGVLGVVVDGSVRLEGGRGHATIRFSDREDVEPVWRDIAGGIIRSVSVGYRVHEYVITKRDGECDHYLAVDWEPLELSAVAIGADPEAQVRGDKPRRRAPNACVLTRQDAASPSAAAITKGGHEMPEKAKQAAAGDTERRETEATFTSPAARTAETSAATAAEERTQTPASAPAAAPDAEAIRAEERRRVADVAALCRRHGLDGEFAEGLVSRGVSLDAARTAILDQLAEDDPLEGRSYEPSHARARDTGARDGAYRDAVTSALMHRSKPGEHQLTDAAREFRGFSLLEMARHALERTGMSTRGMSRMELAGAVFQQRGVGYQSTSDLASILANVAGKTLRRAYESTPRTFTAWTRRATITDFKPASRVQLGGAPDLQKVLEAGEFTYGSIGEGKENYALAIRPGRGHHPPVADQRRPRRLRALSGGVRSLRGGPRERHRLLGPRRQRGDGGRYRALPCQPRQPRRHGERDRREGALRRLPLVRWADGSRRTADLDPAALDSRAAGRPVARGAKAGDRDHPGRDRRRQHLRRPPRGGGGAAPHSVGGQDPWFLAADPARIDTVEFAYLEGQEGVYTETRMGFEVDGMEIKARHDFAAKAIDWRGLYKNAGAAPA